MGEGSGMVRLRNEEVAQLRLVSDQVSTAGSADDMKHFVMGIIAVALVLCVVIGSVLVSASPCRTQIHPGSSDALTDRHSR